jgi:hypothetical protein
MILEANKTLMEDIEAPKKPIFTARFYVCRAKNNWQEN